MEAGSSSDPVKEPQAIQGYKKSNIVMELEARSNFKKSFMDFKQSILRNRVLEMSMSRHLDFEQVYKSSLNSLDLDNQGRYLLSGGKDGSLFIHDLYNFTGNKVYQCKMVEGGLVLEVSGNRHTVGIETVQWYPADSGMLLTSGMDGAVRVWDSNVMKYVQTYHFSVRIFQHHISSTAIGNTPLVAVASGLSEVKIVDLRIGQYSQELRGHSNCVFCCRWAPTEPYVLATGSYDSTIRLWDARSPNACFAILDKDNRRQEEIKRAGNDFKSHSGSVNGIGFTADGRLLASLGSDSTMRCWNLHNFKNLNIPFEKINNRKRRAIEFATCGFINRNFCFIPDQFSIVIIELETGKKIKTLCGHYNQVNTCCFHKDRMELYSGGQDRNILAWTVDPQDGEDEKKKPSLKLHRSEHDNWDSD